MNKKQIKVGDLVKLREGSWKCIGIVTQVNMIDKGVDPEFVEVMWIGYHFRHLESRDKLVVLNETGRFS